MTAQLKVTMEGWSNGGTIPDDHAFCKPAAENHITLSRNLSPAIRWSGAPADTRSYAIICHDPDVPSKADDVNQEDRTVPASLPRVDFFHWVLIDIPLSVTELPAGADSDGVTVRGKAPGPTPLGVRGINNYTDWFATDDAMAGDYGGYDGPCPPWNDEIIHHYHFTVYALDVPSLGLTGRFGGADALREIAAHTLAQGRWVGTFTLNPKLRTA